MSINTVTNEPRKGVRLMLQGYFPIRAWQGGGNLWSHDFQLALRQGAIGEFLPRATDEGDCIFFEHVFNGIEVSSISTPSGIQEKVPAEEVTRLAAAFEELKARAENPYCDRNSKRMIESFRLPDPEKDPELYRMYSAGGKRKLLVLWGCEKEEGSALTPIQAIQKVRPDMAGSLKSPISSNSPNFSQWARPLGWLAAAAAAVLVAGLLYPRLKTEVSESGISGNASSGKVVDSSDPSSRPTASTVVNSNPTVVNSPGMVASNSAPAGPIIAGGRPPSAESSTETPTGGMGTKAPTTVPMMPPSAGVAGEGGKITPEQPLEGSSDASKANAPGQSNPSTQSATTGEGGIHDGKPQPKEKQGRSPEAVIPKPELPFKDQLVGTKSDPKMQPTGTPAPPDQPAGTPTSKPDPSSAPINEPGPPKIKSPIAAPTLVGAPITSTHLVTTKDLPPVDAPSPDPAPQSGSILHISKRDTSNSVKDGSVEFTLEASINKKEAAITEWCVDNVPQKNSRGASSWKATLPKGIHTVSATATGPDGKPVSSTVKISVGVVEAATVELSPVNER